MAILKFRVYFQEDDSIYRDISIRHTSNFLQLHQAILKAYQFDNIHAATFYRSNDDWQKGREISFTKYDRDYVAEPLLMGDTVLSTEIKNTNQKFIYEYDFVKQWMFGVELIHVEKVESTKIEYPCCVRSEGIAPPQYGTKGLVDKRLAEMEEKYDLQPTAMDDGFGEEGEPETEIENNEETTGEQEDEFI